MAVGPQIQLFAGADGTFAWRLIGGNNRELGRGTGQHPDEASCRAAIAGVRARPDELRRCIQPAQVNRWAWELRSQGVAVVVGAHSFDRPIRCTQAVAGFLDLFAGAPIAPGVADFGTRRWRPRRLVPSHQVLGALASRQGATS